MAADEGFTRIHTANYSFHRDAVALFTLLHQMLGNYPKSKHDPTALGVGPEIDEYLERFKTLRAFALDCPHTLDEKAPRQWGKYSLQHYRNWCRETGRVG